MNTRAQQTAAKRPAAVTALVWVLGFLGVTALAGSSALLVPAWTPPDEWLDDIPVVSSWVVPGIVLALGFGVGSLVAAWGVRKRPTLGALRAIERASRHHWSWLAALAIGVGQVAWISLEFVFLPEVSGLQPFYGAVGLTLSVLALLPAVRRDLELAPADAK